MLVKGKAIPEKRVVFEALFGKNMPFDDHRVRMAMSALVQATEKYLAINDLLQDKSVYLFRLNKIYRSRNLQFLPTKPGRKLNRRWKKKAGKMPRICTNSTIFKRKNTVPHSILQ